MGLEPRASSTALNCQEATPASNRQPLKMSELPKDPWEEVSVDFYEVSGVHMLVVTDDFSRFPECEFVHSTSAKDVIPKLDKIFSSQGTPKIVRTDNGHHVMVVNLRNSQVVTALSIAKLLRFGPRQMVKLSALCARLPNW